MIKASSRGGLEMERRIRGIAAKYPRRVEAAAYYEANIEMTESKRRCPVYSGPPRKGEVPGTLRASGTVQRPEWRGKTVTCTLSYGGAAEDYAVVQHERLDFFHRIGQAKYLESVLNESAPYMASRIAEHVRIDKER